MKLKNVIKENMRAITLELQNVNAKIGDLENLEENDMTNRGKRIGQRGER